MRSSPHRCHGHPFAANHWHAGGRFIFTECITAAAADRRVLQPRKTRLKFFSSQSLNLGLGVAAVLCPDCLAVNGKPPTLVTPMLQHQPVLELRFPIHDFLYTVFYTFLQFL